MTTTNQITDHGIWDEKTKTWIKPSGTVKQGRRPMFEPFSKTTTGWYRSQRLKGSQMNKLTNKKQTFYNKDGTIPTGRTFDLPISKLLSKGESAHTPDDDGKISRADWRELAISRYATMKETAAERDKLREQVKELLAAAQKIEAHSFYDNQRFNAYIVDGEAMDKLCALIGKRKFASVEADKQGGTQS